MPIQHLSYISHSAPALCDADIDLILQQSRRNNTVRRISGYLQFHGDYFFQILEGPAEELDQLLGAIKADARHTDLRLLFRAPLNQRHFANWSMGFGHHINADASRDLASKLHQLHQTNHANPHRVLSLFFSMMD